MTVTAAVPRSDELVVSVTWRVSGVLAVTAANVTSTVATPFLNVTVERRPQP